MDFKSGLLGIRNAGFSQPQASLNATKTGTANQTLLETSYDSKVPKS
jgi:hypothetical protein